MDFVASLVFQKFLAIQFEPSFLLSRKKPHLHADLGIF